MEEEKLVVAAAVTILLAILFIILVPSLLIAIPLVLLVLYFVFRLPQCNPASADPFFAKYRFGGHRGSPHSFPENSMSGFQQAKNEGTDLIEFDLALSKDGVAVLMHDDDLDRTTNMTGLVRDKTLRELSHADLAAKFNRNPTSPITGRASSEGIPTLEETIRWAVANNQLMLFDVKDYSDKMVGIIVDLFAKYDLYDKAIVCSFYPWVVYKVKRRSPSILTGITWRQHFAAHKSPLGNEPRYSGITQYAAELIDAIYLPILKTILPSFLGVEMILTNERDISPEFVEVMKQKGIRVSAWTVNNIIQAQWMVNDLNISILTDFPYYSQQLKKLNKFIQDGYNP